MLATKRSFKAEPLIFHTFNYVIMLAVVIVTLYPFLNTLAVSLNEGTDTTRGGIYLWPRVWSLKNYEAVFVTGHVVNAFWISVARTVVGTVLGVFLTAMLAYVLSRKEFMFRKFITVSFILTLYFHAGLFPTYFLIKDLHLLGNFMVYILPGMISAFNLIVIRTYIRSLSESLIESAKMDGAGDFRVFLTIIFPLCTPVLATIALFIAVGQWNSWFDTFLYASSDQSLSTLQYELLKLLSSTTLSNSDPGLAAGVNANAARDMVTPMSIRAAITIVASVPILFVYPFLQKHFVAGLQLGGVKE